MRYTNLTEAEYLVYRNAIGEVTEGFRSTIYDDLPGQAGGTPTIGFGVTNSTANITALLSVLGVPTGTTTAGVPDADALAYNTLLLTITSLSTSSTTTDSSTLLENAYTAAIDVYNMATSRSIANTIDRATAISLVDLIYQPREDRLNSNIELSDANLNGGTVTSFGQFTDTPAGDDDNEIPYSVERAAFADLQYNSGLFFDGGAGSPSLIRGAVFENATLSGSVPNIADDGSATIIDDGFARSIAYYEIGYNTNLRYNGTNGNTDGVIFGIGNRRVVEASALGLYDDEETVQDFVSTAQFFNNLTGYTTGLASIEAEINFEVTDLGQRRDNANPTNPAINATDNFHGGISTAGTQIFANAQIDDINDIINASALDVPEINKVWEDAYTILDNHDGLTGVRQVATDGTVTYLNIAENGSDWNGTRLAAYTKWEAVLGAQAELGSLINAYSPTFVGPLPEGGEYSLAALSDDLNIGLTHYQNNTNLTPGIGVEADQNNYLFGGSGNNTITGGNQDDVIYGFGGNDILTGGAGDDIIVSDGGTDTLNGGIDDDTYVISSLTGEVTITDTGGNSDVLVLGTDVFNDITNTFSTGSGTLTFTGSGRRIIYNNIESFQVAGFDSPSIDFTDPSSLTNALNTAFAFVGDNGTTSVPATEGTTALVGRDVGPIILSLLGLTEDDFTFFGVNFFDIFIEGLVSATLDRFSIDFGPDVDQSSVTQEQVGNDLVLNFTEAGVAKTTTLTGVYADGNADEIVGLTFDGGTVTADLADIPEPEPANIVNGTAGNDVLRGTDGVDIINGLAGNDRFVGDAGADVFNGGEGTDIADYRNSAVGVTVDLAGTGSGGDAQGDSYNSIERAFGSSFTDTLTGSDALNFLYGYGGEDTLHGGAGNDRLFGGANRDELFGDAGNDVLVGGGGVDNLFGGDGNDILRGNAGGDRLEGGDGIDSADYRTSTVGVTVNLAQNTGSGGDAAGDSYSSIERIYGSEHQDNLTGTSARDLLYGNGGVDILNGGNGSDILRGGEEGDFLNGGNGFDTADYRDSSSGVTVNLALQTASGGDAQGDMLSSIERVYGSEFVDNLTGNADTNILNGYGGNDTFTLGLGNDTIRGGAGVDTVVFSASSSFIRLGFSENADGSVSVTQSYFTDINVGTPLNPISIFTQVVHTNTLYDVENVQIDGVVSTLEEILNPEPEVENVINGTNGIDYLIGTDAVDGINGLGGNDTISALGSGDILSGGTGNDTFFLLADSESTITDFEQGDIINLLFAASSVDTFAEVFDAASQVGDDVFIDFGSAQVTLENILLSELDAGDFQLDPFVLEPIIDFDPIIPDIGPICFLQCGFG